MEASVDPLFRGPDWKPITPKRGSLLHADSQVIPRVENFLICKAAFEKALFVYPDAHLEMRQGARIILKSKEEPPPLS
jgi:hypothetical protein